MPRETNIQIRRGNSNDWTSANPTLAQGEPGFENDTKKMKLGDGSTAWNSLPYFAVDGGNLEVSGADSCPAPFMKILLEDGSQIQAGLLKPGMKVKTRHETTMQEGSYEVTHVSLDRTERLFLKIGDTNFVCSKSHKFHTGNSWKRADELNTGDVLENKKITEIKNLDTGVVVKITVDEAHTYVCEGLLSHNKTPIHTATPVPPTATPITPTATPITPTPTPTGGATGYLYAQAFFEPVEGPFGMETPTDYGDPARFGTYCPTGQTFNDRPVYRKTGTDWYMILAETGEQGGSWFWTLQKLPGGANTAGYLYQSSVYHYSGGNLATPPTGTPQDNNWQSVSWIDNDIWPSPYGQTTQTSC